MKRTAENVAKNRLASDDRNRTERNNFIPRSGRSAILFSITSSSCHCSLTTPTTTTLSWLLIVALFIRLFQAPIVPLRSLSNLKPVHQQVTTRNEFTPLSKLLSYSICTSWSGMVFERELEEQYNESLLEWLTELVIICGKNSRNVIKKSANYADKSNNYNCPLSIVRPLLTSVQPPTNVWSTITSSNETPLQDDVNFCEMMWWGEMKRKKSDDIAGCSRDEQFEEELHSKLFNEKMKGHKFLNTNAQQIFNRWHESSKNVWLQENDDDGFYRSSCADNNEQCSFTELFEKCDPYGIEQQQNNNNNFLLNSSFESPILHNNVSLADAAICSGMNGSDLACCSEFRGSVSPESSLDDRLRDCASNDLLEDENNSGEWNDSNVGDNEKTDEVNASENDHHLTEHSNEVQYTSTSVVELLEDDESNESFCYDTFNGAILQRPSTTTTTDDNDAVNDNNSNSDVVNNPLPQLADDDMQHRRIATYSSLSDRAIERRLICTSPQFRLPYESDTVSTKSCSSSSRPYSESSKSGCIIGEEEEYDQQYVDDENDEELFLREAAFGQTTSSTSADFLCDHYKTNNKLHSSRNNNDNGVMRSERRGRGRRSRDEELAHAYLLPLSAMQISSLPLTELNRIIHSSQLTSQQQNMIRKIRRRGKNKLAARVCRKRKNDKIKI